MLRILLLLPFLVLLIAFALSNQQPDRLGLWPTDFSIEIPVSIAILASSALFFFLGALFVWFGTVAARGRAKRAERRAEALEAQLRTHIPPAPTAIRPAKAPNPAFPALAAPK